MDQQALLDALAQARPEWTTTFQRGDVLARSGAAADALHLLLSGEVGLYASVESSGAPIDTLAAGAPVGLAAVLAHGAHSSTAIALAETAALRVPQDAVAELAAAAPALFVRLAATLAQELTGRAPGGPGSSGTGPGDEEAQAGAAKPRAAVHPSSLAPSLAAELEGEGAEAGSDAPLENAIRPLYTESVHCPVCETDFEATRIRIRALNAIRRESDLHTVYDGFNPLHYAMDVCPECLYAATPDAWSDCDAELIGKLDADRKDRLQAAGAMRFLGERDVETGIAATLLALRCGEIRHIRRRARASILHKLAWMSREMEDDAQERQYLSLAREEYDRVYREDAELSEAAALRVSYLLGELAFRLGEPKEAIRWFERTVRSEGIDKHGDLDRLAHDRWIDARETMRKSA
ncbi:MAG: protein kinase [Chloroflexi bacterium]|nr:MAG: protein kinase [Chloroflexota bacterium]